MKRFFESVSVKEQPEGFIVLLDKRPLRSPQTNKVVLPSQKLADAVAAEWEAAGHDGQEINPLAMPIFSMAVTVIDRVDGQEQILRDELVRYGSNELICYRAGADDPDIHAHQKQQWDSWCQWTASTLGIKLVLTEGLMPVNQSATTHDKLNTLVSDLYGWHLGCGYRAITLGGSFVLGYAFLQREISAETLFHLCFLDELYQNRKWGADEEAMARHSNIFSELKDVESILSML